MLVNLTAVGMDICYKKGPCRKYLILMIQGSNWCVYSVYVRRCIQKSQDNAHNTKVACSSRVSR